MKTKQRLFAIIFSSLLFFSASSCIDNNNKDNESAQGQNRDSDYEEDAPTYNKTRDDMEESLDTASTGKHIPKDPVERKSKGNASSK